MDLSIGSRVIFKGDISFGALISRPHKTLKMVRIPLRSRYLVGLIRENKYFKTAVMSV